MEAVTPTPDGRGRPTPRAYGLVIFSGFIN
jgi:hypothetical protein